MSDPGAVPIGESFIGEAADTPFVAVLRPGIPVKRAT